MKRKLKLPVVLPKSGDNTYSNLNGGARIEVIVSVLKTGGNGRPPRFLGTYWNRRGKPRGPEAHRPRARRLAFIQDVKARILGNSIAERNCPYVIGLLQTEQMFANVYSVWYNSYRDVLKGIL